MAASLAFRIENLLAPRQNVVLDDRRLPLFKLGARLRDGERHAAWHATVIDEELLLQGAPAEVMLEAVALPPELAPALVSRALEPCLVDHPRIQLVHSVALPAAMLGAVQPAEPNPLVPPLHSLPIADEAKVVLLVKEWLETVPLLNWRQQRGPTLSLGDILDLTDTVAESLAALHRRGYAHGAVVPESIAMQELPSLLVEGEASQPVWAPKLFDVGLTRTLAVPGTWPAGPGSIWCAPEAFTPDALTDWRRVDQLGLAALLYALWTDQVPFEATSPTASPDEARQQRRRQIEALPPPRGNNRARKLGVTPAMSAACMRAMSPEPADRFPSIDAFSQALRRASRENQRKVASGEDTGPGTLPGTYASAKFRSLSAPPPSREPTSTPAPASASAAAKPKPQPLAVPRGAVPDVPAPKFETVTHPPEANTHENSESASSEPQGRVVELREEPKPRTTKVLAEPDLDDGDYPDHPDDEERRLAEMDTLSLPAPSRWAFNNLAAVLLGLWLLTLVALMLRGSSPAPVRTADSTDLPLPAVEVTKTGTVPPHR